MPSPRRRPKERADGLGAWRAVRDEELPRYVASGTGERPVGWWLVESGRPDLADDDQRDLYAHIWYGGAGNFQLAADDDPHLLRAAERLRFLAESGELTGQEIEHIFERAALERQPGRYAWRARVLREVFASRPARIRR